MRNLYVKSFLKERISIKENDIIGLLTLIKKVPKPEDKKREGTYWLCKCECGNTCIRHYQDLYHGDTKSCGCLKRRRPIYDKNNVEISNKAGIYGFQNIYNGHWYIGKSKNLYKRYLDHKNDYKKDKTKQFYQAIDKYGWDAFNYYILKEYDIIPSNEELSRMEEYYIKEKDSFKNGYNASEKSSGGFYSTEHQEKCTKVLNDLNENQKGVNHPRAAFNEALIKEIFELAMQGCPSSEAWNMYKDKVSMTKESFRNTYNGYNYKNLLPNGWEKRPQVVTNSKLWGIDVINIRTRLINGEDPKKIYEDYQEKCSWNCFKDVKNNKTYKNIQPCID